MFIALTSAPLITAILLLGPPATKTIPVTETIHGEDFTDEYRWLEALESESAEVEAWTTEQNNYTRSVLEDLPCRAALAREFETLMTVGSVSAPAMRGNLYFNRKRSGDENHSVFQVRESLDGTPRVLIDPNTLDDNGLISLDGTTPNPDGSLVAFGLSRSGDEMSELHILHTADGRWLADRIPGKASVSGWTPDGQAFLYSHLSDPEDAYSRTIKFHRVGDDERHDPVLFTQKDPSRIPFAWLSDNGRWIIHGVTEGWARNDLFVMDFNRWERDGVVASTPIALDLQGRFRSVAVLGDTLWMTSTLDAPNGMLVAVDLHNPGREHWRTVIPEQKDAVLKGVSHARGLFIARHTRVAVTEFSRFALDGTPLGALATPGIGTAKLSTRDDRTDAFMTFSSYNEPRSIYHVDLRTGERTLWARPEVPVDPQSVEVQQVFATSKDGTRVPYFLIHRKDVKPDGKNPCMLYGYGGFNISLEPGFRSTYFPWFNAGGVVAVANLRGGGEYGERWHEAGMRANKQNVFDDLYAVAENLFKTGWTRPEQLAVWGGSNGGLLTGVAVTQRPDLFACAISGVPLLDMLRYQHFLMAKFWVPEYGSSEDAEQFAWLKAYSPYHNITPGGRSPAVLFTAGENDNRVHPLHARKMAARMQAQTSNDQDDHPILLWVDRDAGHGSGKPLWLRIRDLTDSWSFVMWQTGACQ